MKLGKAIDWNKLERVHNYGSKRHGWNWLTANRMALNAARECGVDPSTPESKLLLPVVCLRILNQLYPKD